MTSTGLTLLMNSLSDSDKGLVRESLPYRNWIHPVSAGLSHVILLNVGDNQAFPSCLLQLCHYVKAISDYLISINFMYFGQLKILTIIYNFACPYKSGWTLVQWLLPQWLWSS